MLVGQTHNRLEFKRKKISKLCLMSCVFMFRIKQRETCTKFRCEENTGDLVC